MWPTQCCSKNKAGQPVLKHARAVVPARPAAVQPASVAHALSHHHPRSKYLQTRTAAEPDQTPRARVQVQVQARGGAVRMRNDDGSGLDHPQSYGWDVNEHAVRVRRACTGEFES